MTRRGLLSLALMPFRRLVQPETPRRFSIVIRVPRSDAPRFRMLPDEIHSHQNRVLLDVFDQPPIEGRLLKRVLNPRR